MEILSGVVKFISDVGASAILPIIIALLGLYFRIGVKKAVRNGLMVGIGFLGISTALGILTNAMGNISGYYQNLGGGFTVIDGGWPALGAAGWSTPFAILVIPLGFILNFILVRLKFTKTLNVDLWNYWHFLITACMVYYPMKIAGFSTLTAGAAGTIVALACSVVMLKVADATAESWQEYFGQEGTAVTTQFAMVTAYPIAKITNWILDRIPGVKDSQLDLNTLSKKMGVFGDTAVMSFVIGIILCLITKQSAANTLIISISIAAAIVLLPRMVSVLLEGLGPIGQAASDFMQKKLGDDYDINIGMDVALGLGDSCAIQTAVIMIPITIALGFIVPGVNFFPIGLVGGMVYTTTVSSWASKGNVLKTLVSAITITIYEMVAMSFMAGLTTLVVKSAGTMDLSNGAQVVGTVCDTIYNVIIAIIVQIAGLI
ncbi:MAG: PTS galactitol transporter subunit IIC [Anaerostipes sp.]|jgi:PTS system galactitol-specific IIC component|nr:PTS galactitol transporter subunit IIC [Anaerostipes sp.]MDD3746690.1 PTS galactitol transporter subunit IIC [Anaerostipes sp.]